MVARRKISHRDGTAAIDAVRSALATAEADSAFATLPRATRATAVRYLLEELAALAPGNSVEVRVPPYGVIQCVAGPHHRRGTPPSVVETDAFTWCSVALGFLPWDSAAGKISASGARSNLADKMPLL